MDEGGTLTLHDNWYEAVDLSLTVALQPQGHADVTKSIFANLKAAPMDVDFGSPTGLQFAYSPGGQQLSVQVRVRPATNKFLKSFQIKLGDLPTALNSGQGASFDDTGNFPGIATQFDNPSTMVVLSASSTASTIKNEILLGTIHLNVVGNGLHLIDGHLKEAHRSNAES